MLNVAPEANEGQSMGSKEAFERVLNNLFAGDPSDAASTVAKYFHADFTNTANGQSSTYDEFVKHVAHLRSMMESLDIKVQEFLRDGNMISDRHIATAWAKGADKAKVFEVFLIGELDGSGRMKSVKENTRLISGDEVDEDLGTRSS